MVLVDELSSSLSLIFSFPAVFCGNIISGIPPPKGQVTGHRPMVILRPLSMVEDLEAKRSIKSLLAMSLTSRIGSQDLDTWLIAMVM